VVVVVEEEEKEICEEDNGEDPGKRSRKVERLL